MKISITC